MIRHFFQSFILILSYSATGLHGQTPLQPGIKAMNAFKQELRSLAGILQLPGFSVAVIKDGNIIYRQMEGYANLEKKIPLSADHLFQIASVTKTFTANLIMQYEQEGRAGVDDYALDYRFIDTRFGYPYNVDANTKVRHFLSHISEDGPGHSFVYNGSRFNFIYGIFEKVGGYPSSVDAYSSEIEKRIFAPLKMTQSITGFPDNRNDSMFAHIATPYVFDTTKHLFIEDTLNYRWTKAFPATGILSTIGDLVKYAAGYDKHTLISDSSYQKITTPARLNDGSISPYGIGWFTEDFAGTKIHWHYGHADSYAALFIRVPASGYTFIFLSNSNAPSESLRQGAGRIWQSPFATAFLKTFVFTQNKKATASLNIEDSIGKALFLYYAQKTFHTHTGEGQALLARLYAEHPARFSQYDPALIAAIAEMAIPTMSNAMDRLAAAYRQYGHIQPYVAMDLAHYYDKMHQPNSAQEFYRQLADIKGFETWALTVEACEKVGQYQADHGKPEEGRRYYWKAVNDMRMQFADDTAIQQLVNRMNGLHLKNRHSPQ